MKKSDRNLGEIGQTSKVTAENLDKLVTDVVKLLLSKGVTIAKPKAVPEDFFQSLLRQYPELQKYLKSECVPIQIKLNTSIWAFPNLFSGSTER